MSKNNILRRVFLASAVILTSVWLLTGCSPAFLEGSSISIDEEKTVSAADITFLDIKTSSANINVIPAKTKDIHVRYYGDAISLINTRFVLDTSVSGGTLTIRTETEPFGISITVTRQLTLDISVPEDYDGDISVRCSSGNVKIDDFSLGELKLDLSSGNVRLNSVTAELCDARLSSGNINAEGFSGDFEADISSGNITIAYSEFSNNIKTRASSGNTTIKLPEDAAFYLDASVSSGRIHNDFPMTVTPSDNNDKKRVQGTVGNGDNTITLHASSGNITVEKN